MYREYCVPHCSPEIFICSPASLYDNISRFIFNKEDAHGELMALASIVLGKNKCLAEVKPEEIFEVTADGKIVFKNDWQHKIKTQKKILAYAPLASVVQEAFENVLLKYAQKTKEITNAEHLVAAGGVFLNIKANSVIESSKLFSQFHVPSSPHDAGVAIGCAYYGWKLLAKGKNIPFVVNRQKASDRIGSEYNSEIIEEKLNNYSHLCCHEKQPPPALIADLIADGALIARFAGAAEFGPRALGGRSLLANPLLSQSKNLLNITKGRQKWRPVAPIVIKEKLSKFFTGANDSPYMNLLHFVKPKHRKYLKAILHPDHSARVQTLEKGDDDFLYEVLTCLERKIGYPIIVNTSLNGRGQPLIETPDSAIDFFLSNSAIDYLLIEDFLVKRVYKNLQWNETKLAADCLVSIINFGSNPRYILLRNGLTLEVSAKTIEIIKKLPSVKIASDTIESETLNELQAAMLSKFLIL
jgi:carbamoyltransferase